MSADSCGVADIFRRASGAFVAQFGDLLNTASWRVLNAIINCRTAAMGARLYHCEKCQVSRILYNSCRNRHCGTCQGAGSRRWLDQQLKRVLPAPYFHIVFTLPKPIAELAYANRKTVLAILMRVTAETLVTIAADPKRFGARVGGTVVLHTWDQKILWHPHTHAVVANAGFDVRTGQWKAGSSTFFAPVKVLARYFRRRFLEQLQLAYRDGQLIFPGRIERHGDPQAFEALIESARAIEWNVYAKRPFAGPRQLIGYLARYTHRVAISDSRVTRFDGQTVSFRYRKPTRQGADKPGYAIMTLPAVEFIRRYMMHVLPNGFHRIRHFGILANSNAKSTMEKLAEHTAPNAATDDDERQCDNDTHDYVPKCPACQRPLNLIGEFLPDDYRLVCLARAPPLTSAA